MIHYIELKNVAVGSQVYWQGERWQVLPDLELASLENLRDISPDPLEMVVLLENPS